MCMDSKSERPEKADNELVDETKEPEIPLIGTSESGQTVEKTSPPSSMEEKNHLSIDETMSESGEDKSDVNKNLVKEDTTSHQISSTENPASKTRSSIARRTARSLTSSGMREESYTNSLSVEPPSNVAPSPNRGVALTKKPRAASLAPTCYQDLHVFGKANVGNDKHSNRGDKVEDKCFQTKYPTIIAHNKDYYCWICHKDEELLPCNKCFRVYHKDCLEKNSETAVYNVDTEVDNWECCECLAVEKSLSSSRGATWLSLENLGMCLQKVVSKLINTPSFDLFTDPVSSDEYPDYSKYIYKPVYLSKLDKKAMTLQYSCGEQLTQDCKLLLHNSAVFNGPNSPITSTAKRLLSTCEKELASIEACPDCFCNSLLRDDFFETPCRIPHPLVWAKYGSYPFWPSKVFQMKPPKLVDVRFFGEHDRANVPLNQVYFFSKNPPEPVTKHVKKFENACSEIHRYIKKLQTYQSFKLAADKTKFTPPRAGEAFGPLNVKIAEDLKRENEESPCVSPDILKQIANSVASVQTSSKSSKKKRRNSGGKDQVVSDVELSSDSSSDESDNETLISAIGKKTSDTKEAKSSNGSVSGSRGKRGHSLNTSVASEATATQDPPLKKSKRDSTAGSDSDSVRSSSLPKIELRNFGDCLEDVKTPKSKSETLSEKRISTGYNKTRSRRKTSPSHNSSLLIDDVENVEAETASEGNSEQRIVEEVSANQLSQNSENLTIQTSKDPKDDVQPMEVEEVPRLSITENEPDELTSINTAKQKSVTDTEPELREEESSDEKQTESANQQPSETLLKTDKPSTSQSPSEQSESRDIDVKETGDSEQSLHDAGSLGNNGKKLVSQECVLSELEETGRGKRTKFKNALYTSDEELDMKAIAKSASVKKTKDSSSLAATLQAKKQAIQSPKSESGPGSPVANVSKHVNPPFPKASQGTFSNVKPVILNESSNKSKPKGVVKGTPQPTPPKFTPGPSSEEALVDKVTERLSGSLGELVKQILEAQSKGESGSTEDIINAIMNRNYKSAASFKEQPLTLPPFPPIQKKVETRDSPAQVDIPDELAATQRAELRRVMGEKQALLDERQKLRDEIVAWQRKVKAMKEAESERREQQVNKSRLQVNAKMDELKREKSLQLNDLTRHYELLLAEVETNLTGMHQEEMRKLKEEKAAELKEVKRKQWCAYCLKESQYHCCWNTSYCDYRCQMKHWSEHMKTCTQKSKTNNKKTQSTSEQNKTRPSPMQSPNPSSLSSQPQTPLSAQPQPQLGPPPQQPNLQLAGPPPPGAHIVTLPPGAMPPPGSVPMMTFNATPPSVPQQPPPPFIPTSVAAFFSQ